MGGLDFGIVEQIRGDRRNKKTESMAMAMASEWKQVTYKKAKATKATNEKAASAVAAGGADGLRPAQARHAQ